MLVVAGARLHVGRIGDGVAVGREEEEFAFDPGLHLVAERGSLAHDVPEHAARRLIEQRIAAPEIGREPADLRLPRKLDQCRGIGARKNVLLGRRHVEPGRESAEGGTRPRRLADGRRRHQLGALDAEEVGERDEEIPDAAFARGEFQILRHTVSPRPRTLCGQAWWPGQSFD